MARKVRPTLMATTACSLALWSIPAMADAAAQPVPPPPNPRAATPPSAPDTGEIIITGARNNQFGTDVVQSGSFRNQRVIDVPLTVAVIPDAVLKSQEAVDLTDAVRNTAGVSMAGTGPVAYNNITIRGITVDTTASYKLDGALNILSSTAFPLENKDRVEVLKGASALYYGFSPPSGIVNLVMKRPTPELNIYANAFADNHGTAGGTVDVGDTTGIFGYRLIGVAAHLDTGIKYSVGSRYLASGSFDLKPTDKLTITGDVEYFEKSIVEPALFIMPNGATRIPDVSLLNPKTNIGGANWDVNHTHEFNYLGKAVYKFNRDWNISAYYGRSHLRRLRNNPGFQPANITSSFDPESPLYGAGKVRFSAQDTVYTNYNYAAELSGILRWGKIKDEVLVGASRAIRYLASSPNVRTLFAQNFADPVLIPDPHLTRTARPPASRINDEGIYAFDRLSFNDVVQVLGGVRKSSYSNDGSINAVTKSPYHVTPTAYSAGVLVKPVKWVSAYGTYIEGLEENTTASTNTDNAFQVFAPIQSKLYEAGLKLEPHKNLLIQLSYFNIERNGAEEERAGPDTPTTGLLHAYADADERFKGVEGSLTGYVTRDFAVYATYTALSARFVNQPAAIAGHRINGTPKNTASLFGEYTLSWLDPGLKVDAGVYHTGSQPLDDTNKVFVPAYTTFDVGGSYTFKVARHQLTARVYAQNFTGKRYWATVSNGVLAENVPNTVKLSLSFQY